MKKKEVVVRFLSIENLEEMLPLTQQLNPEQSVSDLRKKHLEMFKFSNYKCFGLYANEQLVGLSSGWITVKLYSGKQLEVDNFIIDATIQSQGYGKVLLQQIERWARENDCEAVELNAYVTNGRGHKFYFNQGYSILGFHFQKRV